MEKEGFPPLRITGRALKGGDLTLDGSVSSQYISALLMIAPTMMEGLRLTLTGNIISIPYIKMTLEMLKEHGIKSTWKDNVITITPQEFRPIHYVVESDWSAASYWYEIVSLASGADIFLKGLKKNSMQGDSRIAEIFRSLGVETIYEKDGVRLRKTNSQVERLDLDLSNEPDLAQTIVVTCALKNIPFRITGLQTLKIKETDRILALRNELLKLGYVIKDENDSVLYWDGQKTDPSEVPVIDTYEDHRMAMAFAPAAFIFNNLLINEPHVVSNSSPSFWAHLSQH